MTLPRNLTIALIAGTTALAAAVSAQAQVKPSGEKVAFPENYAQGVLFATLDRADNKQYREFYTSQAAIEAAKRGEPLPNGTVIINVQYAAQLDAQVEKRAGWGTEYPDDIRNGEWEYQAFRPDKTPNTNANLTNCYTCHKPLGLKQDFVFTYERLKAATR
jgi:hypothetical protein